MKKLWRIVATEIVKYEIGIEAETEDKALDKGYLKFKENPSDYEVDRYDYQLDDIRNLSEKETK